MFIRQQKRAKTQMAQKIAKHTSRDAPRRHLSGHKCARGLENHPDCDPADECRGHWSNQDGPPGHHFPLPWPL